MSGLVGHLLDFVFSSTCLGCQKQGALVCSACQERLPLLTRQICPYCGRSSLTGQIHEDCCHGYFLDGLVSAFSYRSLFKEIIAQIKFEPFVFSALENLTNFALDFFKKEESFLVFNNFLKEKPVVIPIPLHKSKFRQRGFNQARIIGERIADYYGLPLEDKLLLRKRSTSPQFELNKKERQKNIRNAFVINADRLSNCQENLPPVLLIDDIWTSGTTAKEAGRTLKKAGLPKVWVLTLAQ